MVLKFQLNWQFVKHRIQFCDWDTEITRKDLQITLWTRFELQNMFWVCNVKKPWILNESIVKYLQFHKIKDRKLETHTSDETGSIGIIY